MWMHLPLLSLSQIDDRVLMSSFGVVIDKIPSGLNPIGHLRAAVPGDPRKNRDSRSPNLPAASRYLSPVSAPRRKTSDIQRTDGSTPATCPGSAGVARSCRAHGQGSAAWHLRSVPRAQYLDRSDTCLNCSVGVPPAVWRASGPPIERPGRPRYIISVPHKSCRWRIPKSLCPPSTTTSDVILVSSIKASAVAANS